MSGGHWGYMQNDIDKHGHVAGGALRLIAQIEHELDWGVSCDTCLQCAERRVIAALHLYFDTRLTVGPALALVRDREQNLCDECRRRRGEA